MEKRNKIIFWIVTGMLTALMLMSASMYILKYEMISQTFVTLGFPTFVIYPLAIAKILGLIAIWTNKSKLLKEWAYAGFFFDFILALGAHLTVNDGQFGMAAIAIVLLIVSRIFELKVRRA